MQERVEKMVQEVARELCRDPSAIKKHVSASADRIKGLEPDFSLWERDGTPSAPKV